MTSYEDNIADNFGRPDYFDELDPCCQKEIDMNVKKERIRKELRKTDRSNKRFDMQTKVLNDLREFKNSGCSCCRNPDTVKDYPLLAKLRNSKLMVQEDFEENKGSEVADSDQSDDEYDEYDELLNDNSLTAYDNERLEDLRTKQLQLKRVAVFGLGKHTEDSLEHIRFIVQNKYCFVLHCYDSEAQIDAEMDLLFDELALTYSGTFFRRLPLDGACTRFLLEFSSSHDLSRTDEAGMLVLFRDGKLDKIMPVNSFGGEPDSSSIRRGDLVNYLDKCKILVEPDAIFAKSCSILVNEYDDEEEEEVDRRRYCSESQCDKDYPHEHIVSGKGATFAGSSSKSFGADEVLGDKALYRL
jgi:hypothetical protein